MSAASAWWAMRSAGERRTLRFGLAAAIVVVAAVAWIEIERTRARLDTELPRLRASIAALERDAAEVKRLRLAPAPAAQPSGGTALANLATNGGGLAGAQVTLVDDKHVKVAGGDVAFAALLEWLQNAQATHAMRVESARIEALPAAGRVRAELTLARS